MAQDTSEHKFYEMLDFKDFLEQRTNHPIEYVKSLYKQIKYPAVMKENEEQAFVEVLMINHGIDSLEVLMSAPVHSFFCESIMKAVTHINAEQVISSEDKYMTRLEVEFHLIGKEKITEKECPAQICGHLRVLAYPLPLIKYNSHSTSKGGN